LYSLRNSKKKRNSKEDTVAYQMKTKKKREEQVTMDREKQVNTINFTHPSLF